MKILRTDRLLLRPFTEEDFAAVHAYAANPDNVIYMGWGPNGDEDTRNFISETIEKANADPRMKYDFAVTLSQTGHLIGGCGIYLNDERNQGMLGWILHMDHWRQGYGTELAGALIRFGFETLNLHRIWATCNADNYGSYRVMERCGMRREAHFIKAKFGRVHDREAWFDELYYGCLAEEWKARIMQ